jgi:hypothetical protein
MRSQSKALRVTVDAPRFLAKKSRGTLQSARGGGGALVNLCAQTDSLVVLKSHSSLLIKVVIKLKTKLRGLSPRANYTDRAIAACRRSSCQLLRIEHCHVVSVTDP